MIIGKAIRNLINGLGEAPEGGLRPMLKWLWNIWKGNRLQAFLNAAIGMVSVLTTLAQVWAMQNAIDVAAGYKEGNIYMAVALMGLLILLEFSTGLSTVWIRNILGVKAQNKMQQRIMRRLLQQEWRADASMHSGDITNRLVTDVTTIVNFLTETLPSALSVMAMFVGAFFYLFTMDHWLAIITIAIVPVFVLLSKIYMKTMRRLNRAVRTSDSEVQSMMQETVQNRMLIKTLESESFMIGRLESAQRMLRHRVARRTQFSMASNLILNSGFAVSYLVAFLWAALRLISHTLTFGGLSAFLQLVNHIQSPARQLGRLVPAFANVLTSTERLMQLEDIPLEQQGDSHFVDAPVGMRINDVSYRYKEDGRQVLDHLTFDFKPSTCTAVLGPTGSGKTTTLRLLLALLRPQQGTITVYSQQQPDVQYEMGPLLRCNIVYVPQGNTLLSGTIRDNLLMGRRDATDEEMRQALTTSCAEFVMQLPDGLDTVCTEKGGGLSEGQCQRISIARALLRDRPVMLFDEATSALDPATEKRLLHNILSTTSKTIIFITHRPAVVEYCHACLEVGRRA